jgi:Na+/phosphate symporter
MLPPSNAVRRKAGRLKEQQEAAAKAAERAQANANAVTKLTRHYMVSQHPAMSRRLRDLEQILDNQIDHYKVAAHQRKLDKGEIDAVRNLVSITTELERQNDIQVNKLNATLETLTPEELELAEQQALELLGVTNTRGALVQAASRPADSIVAREQPSEDDDAESER